MYCIVSEVNTDAPQKSVSEGEDASVCVHVTGITLKGLLVTLQATAKSAEGER